jgi:release factor glutamine methyltransferase
VSEQIEFVHGDLLSAVAADRRFDYVASNPPYVRSHEMKTLAAEVAEREPRVALEAGPRGTEVFERLIPQAAERLRAGGGLVLEISPMLEPEVVRLLAAEGGFEILPIVKDLAGLSRVISARRTG